MTKPTDDYSNPARGCLSVILLIVFWYFFLFSPPGYWG